MKQEEREILYGILVKSNRSIKDYSSKEIMFIQGLLRDSYYELTPSGLQAYPSTVKAKEIFGFGKRDDTVFWSIYERHHQ